MLYAHKKFDIELSEDGKQLRFYYPSVIGELYGYLRGHVLNEFGVRNSKEPCEKYFSNMDYSLFEKHCYMFMMSINKRY